jgi:hypothetical protein
VLLQLRRSSPNPFSPSTLNFLEEGVSFILAQRAIPFPRSRLSPAGFSSSLGPPGERARGTVCDASFAVKGESEPERIPGCRPLPFAWPRDTSYTTHASPLITNPSAPATSGRIPLGTRTRVSASRSGPATCTKSPVNNRLLRKQPWDCSRHFGARSTEFRSRPVYRCGAIIRKSQFVYRVFSLSFALYRHTFQVGRMILFDSPYRIRA